jgi:3-deoxy-D-manno-octulosonic-acid transferase
MVALYNILLLIGALFALPYYGVKMLLTGKYRKSLCPKFGWARRDELPAPKGSPRIWIHAVSVGEVTAAAPIVACLRSDLPEACIVLSTSTETGQEAAQRLIPEATGTIYYPLDVPFVVRKVLGRIRPDIFAATETELWPNFIRIAGGMGVKIVMVNGRISPRSYRKYNVTRFFWREILRLIDQAGMISEIDAGRLRALGMAENKVHILGNAKYDSLAAKVSRQLQEAMVERLGIADDERIFVAGSTHEGEELVVLDVYRRLLETCPDLLLVIAPRHIERSRAVTALVKGAGFEDAVTLSEITGGRRRKGERVIVVDLMGELFALYSLAAVVFCGGSLVPKGGQNILEPAAWGKVVFYGPSMEDFSNEKALLEAVGGGVTVNSGDELLHGVLSLLAHPEDLAGRGERGRAVVMANQGAARRYADLIRESLG